MPKSGRIGIVVQARMGSKRLPGKALAEIAGEPLLKRLCDRMRRCRLADEVIVATSNEPDDDAIFDACRSWGFAVLRGPAEDLTTRFLRTVKVYRLNAFVRVTGDNPLTDPDGIDELIVRFNEMEAARQRCPIMLHNMHRKGYPYGTGAEIANAALLTFCNRTLLSLPEREQFAQFAKRPRAEIDCRTMEGPQSLIRPQYFLTVDYPEDLQLLNKIHEQFQARDDFNLPSVIEFLDRNPALPKMNAHLHEQFPE